eukprot:1141231-Alexandrium_andersonii.AAC.1
MSASLVGPEMCIRDRTWTTGGAGSGIWNGRTGRRPTPGGISGVPGIWSFPVSYTHLTLPTICSV